jgi:rfaE bifunctional protein nucleotidyltransferase chain/domain
VTRTTKICDLAEASTRIAAARAAGKSIVQCHGVFDLLHVGHIRHLAAARGMGDFLVVTVTPDRYVNKGPDRPAFGEELRAEALAALDCVDVVALNQWPTAVETVAALRPDLFVKGGEYRNGHRDVSGGIERERAAVEAAGGRLAFTDELTFSSSNLLNRFAPVVSEEARAFLRGFRERHGAAEVHAWLERARPLRALVVGETIIDEYQYCDSIGKSSKATALVAKAVSAERFAGGIMAVANHVASLCDEVTVVTQLGRLAPQEDFVREHVHARVRPVFLYRDDAPTIVKRRFIESYFFTPMFELYEINDNALGAADDAALCAALERELGHHDLVIVVDYGHCMLTTSAARLVAERARFLALNAQANAGNRGYHRISKYPRADFVCAAEHEMYLEAHDWRGDLHPVVSDVSRRLSCPRVLVTLGKRGALCYAEPDGFFEMPALASKVVDRVGAGDAFLAVAAPLAAAGAPMEIAAFAGNVAGAEAVATVGHRSYIERAGLAKHVDVLLA